MNKLLKAVMLVFVVIICVSFFTPWVNIDAQIPKGISRFIAQDKQISKQASLKTISGFQVPIMVNGPDAKLMIRIIKIFNPSVTDVDKKSWLIWGIPGLAVALFVLILFLGKNKWVNLGIGILGVAIFAGVTFKLLTTNLDKVVLSVSIAPGLWVLLYAYLGIGVISLIGFCRLLFSKHK